MYVLVSNPDLPDPNLEGFRERIWVRNYPCACCGNDNMVSMEFIVKQYYSFSGVRIDQGRPNLVNPVMPAARCRWSLCINRSLASEATGQRLCKQ